MPASRMNQKIEGHNMSHLLNLATKRMTEATQAATVLDSEAEESIPKFKKSELTIGRVLGRGGFCVANEITKIHLSGGSSTTKAGRQEKDEHTIYNIVQDRGFMSDHCIRSGRDCRYAIKTLQDASFKEAGTFVGGLVDLAVEAKFLSVVRHPNIIKMRAMADSPVPTKDPNFFIVLDKLYDILSTRLTKWKKQNSNKISKLLDAGGKKKKEFWLERMQFVYDMSAALVFMHENRIIYRDLKPDNVGFDVRGDIKVFDLGLAKELQPHTRNADGMYNLTGDTGSPRYMAPEVAKEEPYNFGADTYSFAILAWEMLALKTPYEGYTMSMLRKRVIEGGVRPKCTDKFSKGLQAALTKAWGPKKTRLTMEEISDVFKDEINVLYESDVGGERNWAALLDKSEKSARGSKFVES